MAIKRSTKASVICLTYNHEKYIAKALDSFLMQKTDFFFDIVVCNDASTDNTLSIVNDYIGRYPGRIKLLNHAQNIGPTRSLMEAMQVADGVYVAGCEGDDYWLDDTKLQRQVDFLDNHSDYSGCVADVCLVDEEGRALPKQRLFWLSRKKVFRLADFDGLHVPGHVCTFVRRNFFLDENFCADEIRELDDIIGDRSLFLVWLCHGDIYRIPIRMAAYRVSRKGENLTAKHYAQNQTHTQMEFAYILRLQQYIEGHRLGIRLEKRKRMLYTDALVGALRYGGACTKIPAQIWRANKNKLLCLLAVPYYIIRKILIKLLMVG